jgi:hypothetical protein
MGKKLKQKKVSDAKKVDYYKKTNSFGNIEKIIFPNTLQVGLADDLFDSTISGSIHVTRQGLSYLIAGTNISIASGSNGQITIAASTSTSAETVTAETGDLTLDAAAGSVIITAAENTADAILIHAEHSGGGIDFKVGSSVVVSIDTNSVDIAQPVNIDATTASSSTSSGALVVDGGVGIAADLYIGDDLNIASDDAVVNLGSTSIFTLTHTNTNNTALISANHRLAFGAAADYITGDGTDISIVSSGDVIITGDLLPAADDIHDIGSATAAWQDLFLEGDITLTDTGKIVTTAGNLTIEAEAADAKVVIKGDQTSGTSIHIDGNAAAGSEVQIDAGILDIDVTGAATLDATSMTTTAATQSIAASTSLGITSPAVIIDSAASGKPVVTIKTTHTAKTASGELQFLKDAADTEDGEILGKITFFGEDEGNNNTQFAGIVASISESDETDEAGTLELQVAESDGTNTAMTTGLKLEGEHATDGQIDVTIAAGAASTTTIAGDLTVTTDLAVDGISNLDNVDIDGTFKMDGVTFDVNASGAVTIDGTTISIDGTDDVNLTVTSSTAGEDLTIAQVGANDSSIIITAAGTGTDAIKIDATAGDMLIAPTLINGKTLKIGPTSATEMVFTPSGTAANEKISITNTAGTAADAIAIVSTAGGITLTGDTDHGVLVGTVSTGPVSIGHTTSETTVNDNLTVTGKAVITSGDIDLGNGQAGSIAILNTAAGTAGKALTISAGTAATAGSNNTAGGSLILKAGGGDGTGTSDVEVWTKTSGTDAATEKLKVDGAGNISVLIDNALIGFGENTDITLTHVHDVGLTVTNTINGTDNRPVVLQLKSEEDTIVTDDVIASLEFAAGDSDGTDGAGVAAGIHAIAEGTFGANANATKLVFTTGVQESANSAATPKMILDSAGNLTLAGELQVTNIGYTDGDNAIVIADGGGVTSSAGITSTASANTFGATSFNDANITHVGALNADTIQSDAAAVGLNINFDGNTETNIISLIDNAQDALLIKEGANIFMKFDTANSAERIAMFKGLDLVSDGVKIKLGVNGDVVLQHEHDVGVIMKHNGTADDKPMVLTLQTGEEDIEADDVIAEIRFQAPDEASANGDNNLVAASIAAVSEGNFSNTANATKLSFRTAKSEDASLAAQEKMSIDSGGSVIMNAGTTTAPGAGFNGGEDTVVSRIQEINGVTITTFEINIDDQVSTAGTGLRIMGDSAGAAAAHFARLDSGVNGLIYKATMVCMESPAGGEPDLDVYAESAVRAEGASISGNYARIITARSDHVVTKFSEENAPFYDNGTGATPGLHEYYLYLVNGTGGTMDGGTYSAGKFLLQLYGIKAFGS